MCRHFMFNWIVCQDQVYRERAMTCKLLYGLAHHDKKEYTTKCIIMTQDYESSVACVGRDEV